MRRLWVAMFLFLCVPSVAHAQSLAWDANDPAQQITHYLIHYGPTTTYTGLIDAGTATQSDISALLVPGKTIHFAVAAQNSIAVSGLSADVAYTPLDVDHCAVPFGDQSLSATITDVNGVAVGTPVVKPSSTTNYVDVKPASLSPITTITTSLNGMPTPDPPASGASVRGVWFTVPATPGVYAVTLTLHNLFGCGLTTTAPHQIQVKP